MLWTLGGADGEFDIVDNGEVTAAGNCWVLVRKGAAEAAVEALPLTEVAFQPSSQSDRVLMHLWRGAFADTTDEGTPTVKV